MKWIIFGVLILATPALAEETCTRPFIGKCTCFEVMSPKEIMGYNEYGTQHKDEVVGTTVCLDSAMNATYHDPAPPKNGLYQYSTFGPGQ